MHILCIFSYTNVNCIICRNSVNCWHFRGGGVNLIIEFYLSYINIGMTTVKLEEIKSEVQRILDKHIEPENRISIQELDEETVFLIIDLLLEQDDLEREKFWAGIEDKLKQNQMNLRIDFEKIMEIKDKLDFQKSERFDLTDLQNLVDTEHNLDNQLNNL